jgi:hypothetical protein
MIAYERMVWLPWRKGEIMDSGCMQGNTIMHSKLLCIKGCCRVFFKCQECCILHAQALLCRTSFEEVDHLIRSLQPAEVPISHKVTPLGTKVIAPSPQRKSNC